MKVKKKHWLWSFSYYHNILKQPIKAEASHSLKLDKKPQRVKSLLWKENPPFIQQVQQIMIWKERNDSVSSHLGIIRLYQSWLICDKTT